MFRARRPGAQVRTPPADAGRIRPRDDGLHLFLRLHSPEAERDKTFRRDEHLAAPRGWWAARALWISGVDGMANVTVTVETAA
jgi:hypothetical protein